MQKLARSLRNRSERLPKLTPGGPRIPNICLTRADMVKIKRLHICSTILILRQMYRMTTNDIDTYKIKGTHCILCHYRPRVPNFTPFRCTIRSFYLRPFRDTDTKWSRNDLEHYKLGHMYPMHVLLVLMSPIFHTASVHDRLHRVIDHFEPVALNNHQMTFNSTRSKVPCTCIIIIMCY